MPSGPVLKRTGFRDRLDLRVSQLRVTESWAHSKQPQANCQHMPVTTQFLSCGPRGPGPPHTLLHGRPSAPQHLRMSHHCATTSTTGVHMIQETCRSVECLACRKIPGWLSCGLWPFAPRQVLRVISLPASLIKPTHGSPRHAPTVTPLSTSDRTPPPFLLFARSISVSTDGRLYGNAQVPYR